MGGRRGLRGVWASLAVGLGCALALQSVTQLAGHDGRGYAPHVALRLQTEALLRGELALQPHPFGAQHDWLWGRGGVYQPWGLGVPLLRLPGEVAARAAGAIGFPDRFVFLAGFALAAATFFGGLRRALGHTDADPRPAALLGTAFVTLFPAFVVLIDSRFSVYEEVEAWGCLWAVLVLGLLLRYRAEPGLATLLLLASSVALAPVIRLTGLLFGGSAFLLALLYGWRARVPRGQLLLASGVALLGPAVLLLLNAARFGDPFELGFGLVLAGPHVNDLQRLQPARGLGELGTGLSELLLVALAPESATHEPISRRFWTGAATSRFVDVYFAPFRPSMLLALGACFLPWLVEGWRRRAAGRARELPLRGLDVLVVWGVLILLGLGALFSLTPAITSRYAAELSPAWAACLLSGALLSCRLVRERSPRGARLWATALVCVAGLWFAGRQTEFFHPFHDPIDAKALSEALARSSPRPVREIPTLLECRSWPQRPYEIGWNLRGWDADCRFRSGLQAVLPASACIELELAASRSGGAPESLDGLRVKSDLRELELQHRVETASGTRLRFCEGEPAPWRLSDLQLVTVGRGPDRTLQLRSIHAVDRAGEPAD